MKKQKNKHRHKGGNSNRDVGRGLRLIPHPLAGVNPDAVKAALLAIADKKIAEFPKLIEAVQALLQEKYPPHILSTMAAYGLQVGVSAAGIGKRLTSNIEQHHVEVLQALAMMLPYEQWGGEPAVAQDVQTAIDTITELADAFHHRRYKAVDEEADAEARAMLSLQERLRLHTQAVRNWGSYSQVVRISEELYSTLDDEFRGKLGFSASDVIATARHLVSLLEGRTAERFQWLKRVFREHNIRRIVRTYYKYHPSIVGDADEFMKILPPSATREQVLAMLLQHADLLLEDYMSFAAESVAQSSGLSVEITKRVLDALGLVPGALKAENPEHLFMGNPIWAAPIIVLEGKYFCPLPQGVFSHAHRIMLRLAEKAGIVTDLKARRAKYLEAKVGALLAAALPAAKLCNGTKWRLGDVEYETDHLAVIDVTAVIVEDKSAALSESGLRGGPDRVRRHVGELIGDPSEQSARLEALIWRAKAQDSDAVKSLAPFDIDFGKVERVLRVSVTLDDFTALSSAELDLKEAGWIRRDLALAPTMNVADFEAVLDILEQPTFVLHYFAERQRVQKDGHVFADEMDFLGCYLENGLNLGDLEKQKLSVALTGMSAPVDHFYNSADAGVSIPKPRPKLARYMAILVDAIEGKAFPRWTAVTTDILRSAIYNDQKRLEKLLEELRSKVERNWHDPEHECSLAVHSHALGDTVVIFFVYPPELVSERKERAEGLAAQLFDRETYNRCVVVGRNTARWAEPYAHVFIYERDMAEAVRKGNDL